MPSHRRYNVVHPYTIGLSNQFHKSIKDRLNLSQHHRYRLAVFVWHCLFAMLEILAIGTFWYVDSFEAGWGTQVTSRPTWSEFSMTRRSSNALASLSIIFLASFIVAALYADSLHSHFVSVNALVEVVTSAPTVCLWIGSFFDDTLKNVYLPWFLRVWPLLSHVVVCTDYAAPKYLQAALHEIWRLIAAMFTAAGSFHLAENLLGDRVPSSHTLAIEISNAVADSVQSLVSLTGAILGGLNSTSGPGWSVTFHRINTTISSSSSTTSSFAVDRDLLTTCLVHANSSLSSSSVSSSSSSKSETTEALRTISFFETIYFTVVTFGTIGYGDVVPTNQISRLIAAVIIIYALYRFPSFFRTISEHADSLDRSLEYRGSDGGKCCHVVISGDLDTESIGFALDMFCRGGQLVREVDGRKFQVVILSPNEFSQHVQLLVNGPRYDSRVVLLRGIPESLVDLQRARVAEALAHFYITKPTRASDESDTATIMQSRKHSLAAPRVPQYITIRRTENAALVKTRLTMMTTMGIWSQQNQNQQSSSRGTQNRNNNWLNQDNLWTVANGSSSSKSRRNYTSRESVISSFIENGVAGMGGGNMFTVDEASSARTVDASFATSPSASCEGAKNRATLLERDRMLFSLIGAACTTPGAVPLIMTLASCSTRDLNGKQLHPWCDQYEWSLENEVMRCACPSVLVGKTFFQVADVFAEFDITVLGFEVIEEIEEVVEADDEEITNHDSDSKAGALFEGNSFQFPFSEGGRGRGRGRRGRPGKSPRTSSLTSPISPPQLTVSFDTFCISEDEINDGNTSNNQFSRNNNNNNNNNNGNDKKTRRTSNAANDNNINNIDNDQQDDDEEVEIVSSSGEDDDADCLAMAGVVSEQSETEHKPLDGIFEEDPDEILRKRKQPQQNDENLLSVGSTPPNEYEHEQQLQQQQSKAKFDKKVSFASNVSSGGGKTSDDSNRKRIMTRKRLMLNPRGQLAIAREHTKIVLVGGSGEDVIFAVRSIGENDESVLALLDIIERGSKVGRDKRHLVSAFLEKIGARHTLDSRNNFISNEKHRAMQEEAAARAAAALAAARAKKASPSGVAAANYLYSALRKNKKRKDLASGMFAVIETHRVHRRNLLASQIPQSPISRHQFLFVRAHMSGSREGNENNNNNNNNVATHQNRLQRSSDIFKETLALVEYTKFQKGAVAASSGQQQQQQQHFLPVPKITTTPPSSSNSSSPTTFRDKKPGEVSTAVAEVNKPVHGGDGDDDGNNNMMSKTDHIVRGFLGRLGVAEFEKYKSGTSSPKPPLSRRSSASPQRDGNSSSASPSRSPLTQQEQEQHHQERILGFINFQPRLLQFGSSYFASLNRQSRQRDRRSSVLSNVGGSRHSDNPASSNPSSPVGLSGGSADNGNWLSSLDPANVLRDHVLLIDLHSACRQESTASNGTLLSDHSLADSEKARARKLFSLIRTVMISNPSTPVVLLARGPIHSTFAELWSTTSFAYNPFHVDGCALDSHDLRCCRPEDARGVAIFTTHDGRIDEDFDTMAMLVSRSIDLLRRKKVQAKADHERLLARTAAAVAATTDASAATSKNPATAEQQHHQQQIITVTGPDGTLLDIQPRQQQRQQQQQQRVAHNNNFNNSSTGGGGSSTSGAISSASSVSGTIRSSSTAINMPGAGVRTIIAPALHHRLTPAQLALLKSEVPKVTTIIALTQPDSISLLPPFAKPRSLLDQMAQLSDHYVPSFLAGHVLTSRMVESLLYFNFFSTSVLDVVKCMLNVQDYEGMTPHAAATAPSTRSPSDRPRRASFSAPSSPPSLSSSSTPTQTPTFGIMPLPEQCTTWRDVRRSLRIEHPGYQAIALYRLVRAIQSDEELAMIKVQQRQRQQQEEEEAASNKNAGDRPHESDRGSDDSFDDRDGDDGDGDGDGSDNDDDSPRRRRHNRSGRSPATRAGAHTTMIFNGMRLSSLAQQQLHQAMFLAASRGLEGHGGGGGDGGASSGGDASGDVAGAGDNDGGGDDEEDDRDESENLSKFMMHAKKSYRYRAKLARQAGLYTADSSSSNERALRQDLRFVYLNPQIMTELVASDLVFFLY